MCLVGLATFAMIRLRNDPHKLGRKSRFSGSHLGGAWVILAMIVNVIWTMFLFRGAAATGEEPEENLPYGAGAFVSQAIGELFGGLSEHALEILEGVGLLLHIGVMLAFLVIVLNSKHLHIFVAPLNVLFKREPVALGAVKPLTNQGKPVTLDDVDDLDEDATLGIGSIEDFSWKGLLDMATCTECGRCQSQCPAWNTEKPLSPKMLIMNLRDHAFAKAPYTLAAEGDRDKLPADVLAEAERPLVGETEGLAWEPTGGAIIDTDVLWSCVTCGACVDQCPVDIEHVDHIIDMRRYQVLVEANFPAELNQLFKGMENKGNPWNMSSSARMDWAKDLPFDVKVVGEDVESLDEVEWLFWVGCAGAYEDRQKKTTRAVAELLDMAGVSFAVLGNGETCTGDQARRAGNEFLFQQLAAQNSETFKEFKVKKVVSTCAHCFNTLKNEYADFGVELEVTHHTQLLNRLVREGKLTPVADGAGASKRSITYHDPCYIGRHNGVYSPPRELLQVLPGAEYVEMERHSEKSFCCGAGGARMWMEENIGERINENRTNEAVGTGADQIAVGCPFCRVMLSDGLTAAQAKGTAREEVEVLDVAQMLLASVKGEPATAGARRVRVAAAPRPPSRPRPSRRPATSPRPRTPSPRPPTSARPPRPAAARRCSTSAATTTAAEPEKKAEPDEDSRQSGGSLFDLGGDDTPAEPEKQAEPSPSPRPRPRSPSRPRPSGGSLFDIPADEAPGPSAKAEPEPDGRGAEGRVRAPRPTWAPAARCSTSPPRRRPPSPSRRRSPEPEPEPEAKRGAEGRARAGQARGRPRLGWLAVRHRRPRGRRRTGRRQPEPEARAEPEADEPAPEPEEKDEPASGGAALSAAATAAATDEPEAKDEPQEPSRSRTTSDEPERPRRSRSRPRPARPTSPRPTSTSPAAARSST